MKKLLGLMLMLPALALGAKVPLVSHSHVYGYVSPNDTVYIPVGDTVISSSTVEAHQQIPFYKAGTFSGMYVRLEENNLTGYCTFYLRINGVRGNSFVALAPGVKIGTDTVNTDTIVSGDKVNYELVTGAGTNILPVANLINFEPSDGSYYQRFSPAAPAGGYILTNGYQPYYSNITGIMGQNFYDHHTYHIMRTSGTFQKFAVYASTNARINPTHLYLYKNGANSGLTITIPAGQWGLIENTTSTVNVVVGDTVSIKMDGVDGADSNAINFRFFSTEFINNTGLIEWSLGTDDKPQNAGDTYTMPHKSALTFGGDEYLMQANSTGTLSNFCVYITQNDVSTTSTVKVRKNGVTDASVVMTIPSASTGTFCDDTNFVTFVSTDTIGYIGNSPSGTGTLYYASIMARATLQSSASGSPGRPVISPSSPPVVNVGTTYQFSSTNTVSWSLVQGSTGSISATGLYTAPGPLQPKKTIYGCVIQPQDHFSTTRISALPVDVSSTNYLRAQSGDAQLTPEPDFPTNVVYNTSQSTPIVTNYTPANDGTYIIPSTFTSRMENGLFFNKDANNDTHLLSINVDSCEASEMYKFYRIGSQGDCLTCNSQSAVKINFGYSNNQGVTAGGDSILGLEYTFREIDECVRFGKPIQHAGRIMAPQGILAAADKWPAKAHAAYGGALPVGSWARLVSTFTVTGTAAKQCIQQAQKDYGMIYDDAGTSGHFSMEQSALATYEYFGLMAEFAADSEYKVKNLEIIDASTLQDLDPYSPTYQSEIVTSTNPYVQPSSFATVKATNLTDGTTSIMQIRIRPVSIGTAREEGYMFMPGTPQIQIPLWVHGASDTTFSCSMTPTLGTLTSDGLYTAPSTSLTRSSTTVTCTATADPANAYIRFPILVSSGTIRQRYANATNGNYTGADGNIWFIDEAGSWRLQGKANGDWRGQTFTGGPEPNAMTEAQYVSSGSGDMLFKTYAPNGTYQINLYFAVGDAFSANEWVFGIDSQNTVYSGSGATALTGDGGWTAYGLTGYKVDLCDIIGACTSDTIGTVTLNVTVTDNTLYFAIRHISNDGTNSGNSFLNAMEIVLTSLAGSTENARLKGNARFIGGEKSR